MLIQRLLQILLAAIVLVAAFGVLAFVLKMAGWLLGLVIKVVVVLVVVAAILRFIELVREKSRRGRGLEARCPHPVSEERGRRRPANRPDGSVEARASGPRRANSVRSGRPAAPPRGPGRWARVAWSPRPRPPAWPASSTSPTSTGARS